MNNDEQLVFDLDAVEADLKNHGTGSVQFDRPFQSSFRVLSPLSGGGDKIVDRDAYLTRLRTMCKTWGDRLSVRFYAHYDEVFDGAVLQRLPEIRSLVINSIYDEAVNLEAIGELPNLVDLHLGVHELKNKRLLEALSVDRLKSLVLEEAKTKALDLAPLARAQNLRSLKIFGHKKNIDAVGELNRLNEFAFNPGKGLSLAFLNRLSHLKSLKFVLGGIQSIEEARNLPAVEEIAFTMTRGLSDVGDLQRFPKLKRFFMQDQPHVKLVLTGARNTQLAHFWFYNCPALAKVGGLENLPALKSFRSVITALNLDNTALPGSLTHLGVFSGKAKNETEELRKINALGLNPDAHPDMPFFYK